MGAVAPGGKKKQPRSDVTKSSVPQQRLRNIQLQLKKTNLYNPLNQMHQLLSEKMGVF